MSIVSGSVYYNNVGYVDFEIELDMSVDEFEYLSLEDQYSLVRDEFNEIHLEYDMQLSDDCEVYIENIEH